MKNVRLKILVGILLISILFLGIAYTNRSFFGKVRDRYFLAQDRKAEQAEIPFVRKILSPKANLEAWQNSGVGPRPTVLRGGVVRGDVACTMKLCAYSTKANDRAICCNSCGGTMKLVLDDGRSVVLRGKDGDFSCGGMDCNIQCTPLQRGGRYEVYGAMKQANETSAPFTFISDEFPFYFEVTAYKKI